MVDNSTALQSEWVALQQEYADFEKWSLLIKLFSVLICTTLVFHQKLDFVIFLLCLILWMLDAIWKTFQNRTATRLEVIEKGIVQAEPAMAMQFHSQWLQNRPTAVGLIIEYAKHGLSPTVAFPHLCILAVCAIVMWWL